MWIFRCDYEQKRVSEVEHGGSPEVQNVTMLIFLCACEQVCELLRSNMEARRRSKMLIFHGACEHKCASEVEHGGSPENQNVDISLCL